MAHEVLSKAIRAKVGGARIVAVKLSLGIIGLARELPTVCLAFPAIQVDVGPGRNLEYSGGGRCRCYAHVAHFFTAPELGA